MKYSNRWLLSQIENSVAVKYLFFWGHQPSKDGRITSSCFSQWWILPFTHEGVVYQTAEHWMMAGKAKLFGDDELLAKIIDAKSPAEVKKLGRQISGFDAALWDKHKFEIVVKGNFLKFSQHDGLKEFLSATNTRVIVEASPVDNIWGIGMASDHPQVKNPAAWRGENLLGYALMEVRDMIKPYA